MKTAYRYEAIAKQLQQQIVSGLLKPGERLPSVRQTSHTQGVSLTTVFRAYYELEARGLVVARPQSGYYVREVVNRFRQPSQLSKPQPIAMNITVSQALRQLPRGWSHPNVIDMAVAVPGLSLLPQAKLNKSLLTILRHLPDSGLGYETTCGFPELRRQVAQRLTWADHVLTPDSVVITTGCIEAITLALRVTTKPGDMVAIESPTYYGLLQVMEGLGLRAFELPTDTQTGPDLEVLNQSLATQPIRAVVLTPTFSNPIGYCMSDEHKKALVDLLASYDVPLIEDDVYGELYAGYARPRTCQSFDRVGRVLLCGSVSKVLAPGYRVGWLVPGRYRDEVIRAQLMQTNSPATLPQAAIADFMQTGRYERHMRQLRVVIQQQVLAYRALILEAFPANTHVSMPAGGLVLWVRLPDDLSVNLSSVLAQAVAQGIAFFPGYLFSTQPQYGQCLRITCGQPLTQLYINGIRKLGELISHI
ncbi:DNA-binding transcriptional MocR family regulator [Spirosoma lacussanchae]|uniref:aminotransferase-like domain-containing protein n=1 Tax=Spirosoma lacussanchae TaxID=1884249 RepID=UPI001108DEAA|nr:PLP-dependent aminotransferase family protein [Spirosoma lacussanchae]